MNLGNPAEITILEFANTRFASRFDCSVGIQYKPLPADDPKLRRPDIGKARRVLGWEPKVALAEGLTMTIEYFKKKAQRDALNGPRWSRSPVPRPDQVGVV